MSEQFCIGYAVKNLRASNKVLREGWLPGTFLEIQRRDAHSKMTQSYIYQTTEGGTHRIPWQASQVDLLASDWELYKI